MLQFKLQQPTTNNHNLKIQLSNNLTTFPKSFLSPVRLLVSEKQSVNFYRIKALLFMAQAETRSVL